MDATASMTEADLRASIDHIRLNCNALESRITQLANVRRADDAVVADRQTVLDAKLADERAKTTEMRRKNAELQKILDLGDKPAKAKLARSQAELEDYRTKNARLGDIIKRFKDFNTANAFEAGKASRKTILALAADVQRLIDGRAPSEPDADDWIEFRDALRRYADEVTEENDRVYKEHRDGSIAPTGSRVTPPSLPPSLQAIDASLKHRLNASVAPPPGLSSSSTSTITTTPVTTANVAEKSVGGGKKKKGGKKGRK